MTFVVTDACIGVNEECCKAVCPEFCIVSEKEDEISFIDPSRCTDCAVCAAACPMNAIFIDTSVPPESREFIQINALYFKDRDAARKRVAEIMAERF